MNWSFSLKSLEQTSSLLNNESSRFCLKFQQSTSLKLKQSYGAFVLWLLSKHKKEKSVENKNVKSESQINLKQNIAQNIHALEKIFFFCTVNF